MSNHVVLKGLAVAVGVAFALAQGAALAWNEEGGEKK